MEKIFPVVDIYTAPIATYPGNWWTFSVGSKKLDPRQMRRELEFETRYYSKEMHAHSFLPGGLYQRLMEGKLGW